MRTPNSLSGIRRRVVVFEPESTGHRLHFVGVIAKALQENDIDYVLALKQGARETQEGETHLRHLSPECAIVDLHEFPEIKSTAKKRKQQLQTMIEQAKPTDVFIPTADLLAQWVGLTGFPKSVRRDKTRMHALMMRGSFAYKLKHPLRTARAFVTEKLLMRTKWTSLFFLDPLVVNKLHKRYGSLAGFVKHMPEPIESFPVHARAEARAQLGIPLDGRVIACAGRMDTRKGIDKLIGAFVAANRQSTDRLVLMGKQEPSIAQLLKSVDSLLIERKQIIVRDQFADESTFEAIFRAADVVAIPYPQHVGSSGILLRAAKAETIILASEWGWVGWITDAFKLGNSTNVSNTPEFAKAIVRTFEESFDFKSSELQKSLNYYHSVQNFQAHWLNTLGESPMNNLVRWETISSTLNDKARVA